MNFKINVKIISFSFLVFVQSVSSMDQNNGEIDKGIGQLCFSSRDIDEYKMKKSALVVGPVTLIAAGISGEITSEECMVGGNGAVCFTPTHAIKLSTTEWSYDEPTRESGRLLNVTKTLKPQMLTGMNFCFPTHIYKVLLDSQDSTFNITLYPRVNPVLDFRDAMIHAIRYGEPTALNIVRSLGRNMGKFQASKLVVNNDSIDKTCLHGDFNHNNIIVTAADSDGCNAEFTLIDIDRYSDTTMVNTKKVGGSLVSDLTYFIYFSVAKASFKFEGSWEDGLEKTLLNLYADYVVQLPQSVCQKLMVNLYKQEKDGTNGCINQALKDLSQSIDNYFDGAEKVAAMQSKAFFQAYKLAFSD